MDVRGMNAVGASAALGAAIVTDLQPASGPSTVRVGPMPERASNMAAIAAAERRYMFGLQPPHSTALASGAAQPHARRLSHSERSHSGRAATRGGGGSLSLSLSQSHRTVRQSVFDAGSNMGHCGRYLWRRCVRLCAPDLTSLVIFIYIRFAACVLKLATA